MIVPSCYSERITQHISFGPLPETSVKNDRNLSGLLTNIVQLRGAGAERNIFDSTTLSESVLFSQFLMAFVMKYRKVLIKFLGLQKCSQFVRFFMLIQ